MNDLPANMLPIEIQPFLVRGSFSQANRKRGSQTFDQLASLDGRQRHSLENDPIDPQAHLHATTSAGSRTAVRVRNSASATGRSSLRSSDRTASRT